MFRKPKTVSGILSQFTTLVDQLNTLAATKTDEAATHDAKMIAVRDQRDAAYAEARFAARKAEEIAKLAS